MMPGIDGVEICQRTRAAAREPYVYMVLLTARTESQDLVDGMDAGADDYLTKPFNAHELRVRLRAGSRILELQEQLVHAREALRMQATHDGLIGLLNRSSLQTVACDHGIVSPFGQHGAQHGLKDRVVFSGENFQSAGGWISNALVPPQCISETREDGVRH